MSRPVVAWFTRKNYQRHRALDPAGLPVAFEDWLFSAGQQVVAASPSARVVIDPAKFSAWCRAQGRESDTSARGAYAQVVAATGRSRGWWHRRVVQH
jgi:hypothetical protein